MDTYPFHSDDLNDLERRLSAWQPSAAGLDADRMLFAAGRASSPAARGRLVWPVVSGCLALISIFLGARWTAERAERLALVAELQRRPAVSVDAPAPEAVAVEPTSPEPPPADTYLAIRRRWERDPGSLLVMAVPTEKSSQPCLTPEPPIARAWPLDALLDP